MHGEAIHAVALEAFRKAQHKIDGIADLSDRKRAYRMIVQMCCAEQLRIEGMMRMLKN